MPNYITQTEAAQQLNITRRALTKAITAGKFATYEIVGKRVLDAAEVARYVPNGNASKGRQSRETQRA